MKTTLLTLPLRKRLDLVLALQRGRQIAGLLGFDLRQRTLIAAAVFQIARNALQRTRRAFLRFQVQDNRLEVFPMRKRQAKSHTHSQSKNILRFLRQVAGNSNPSIRLERPLPARADFEPGEIPWLLQELDPFTPANLFDALQEQGQELLRLWREIETRPKPAGSNAKAPAA